MERIKYLVILILVISILGIVDTGYLTIEHYSDRPLVCTNFSCDLVTQSAYSHWGSVPVSLVGLLHYLTVFSLSAVYLSTRKKTLLKVILGLGFLASITSLYFIYLQAFVLHAWCLYCLISAFFSFVILTSALFGRFYMPPSDSETKLSENRV